MSWASNLLAIPAVLTAAGCAQPPVPVLPILPAPSSVQFTGKDSFLLSGHTVIWDQNGIFSAECRAFNEMLHEVYSLELEKSDEYRGNNVIILHLDSTMKEEGAYHLEAGPLNIRIRGNRSGVFHGMMSLLQMIRLSGEKLLIPCARINDKPSFRWRGMHLDVARHFFTVGEVKRYIDLLALYKFSVFHWHLTDDQGWRIEIKKHPLLTEKGSRRRQTVIGKPSDTSRYDGTEYGGFYTQEEIRDIVAYAGARHITIVPEIEMPGHSLAAISCYPRFSCRQQPLTTGETWGVFEDVYCPGNDSVFLFLQDVLEEVCALFPGKYIHIGGDECVKTRWMTCPKCQDRIRKEKLKDLNALQSYFIKRIEKFLQSKGRNMVGWDEILEGGLAPNATVMSWRGTEGGIAASRMGHDVVMTPGKPCYFDHYQSNDKTSEPLAIGGYNSLRHVYDWNPVPDELKGKAAARVLGAQGNVWTEYIATFRHVEYMSVPRMCALAEVLWSGPERNKDYGGFCSRLSVHALLLDRMKVHFCRHFMKQK